MISLEPGWRIGPDGERLEPALIEVLRGIRDSGSLARAAHSAGLSYRHAWNRMREWQRRFGAPLARLERGRGARLTPLGEKLLDADRRAREHLGAQLTELQRELEEALAAALAPRAKALRLHASHDLALAALPEIARKESLEIALEFHGSLEALAALARGTCDFAGFHIAEQSPSPEIRRRLRSDEHRLIGLATREQGLIVARGNPKRIERLADLTRRDVRLVNRQRGSGTRLVFDQLLAQAGIRADRIKGYDVEEFTHLAVAATVAGGAADAGFGIRAAAAQLGLGFIPLVTERYLLAWRAKRLSAEPAQRLAALLGGNRFKQVLAGLPGYDGAIAGRTLSVEEALAGPRPGKLRPG